MPYSRRVPARQVARATELVARGVDDGAFVGTRTWVSDWAVDVGVVDVGAVGDIVLGPSAVKASGVVADHLSVRDDG